MNLKPTKQNVFLMVILLIGYYFIGFIANIISISILPIEVFANLSQGINRTITEEQRSQIISVGIQVVVIEFITAIIVCYLISCFAMSYAKKSKSKKL